MRKDARETAFRLIYGYLFDRSKTDSLEERLCSFDDVTLDEEDDKYVRDVFEGVEEHFDELKELIGKNAVGYKTDRIYLIDMAILLVATYEIKYREDIPDKVSCNEAVELAKKYSTDKSPSFINGILASILKESK